MPDQTKHGSPFPPGENPGGPGAQFECSEFEALLTDAIEGELSGPGKEKDKASFDAHRRACTVCGPMFAEVEAGRLWLRALEPVEPPPYLMHNILAATTGVVSTRLAPASAAGVSSFGERLREWWDSWFRPTAGFVRQPQFIMSFGMIFFTFSLVLSTAGFKATDVAKIDLRPAALRHAYIDAQIKVVQYYDNIRFVYEIESRVRELKRATTPAEPAPVPKKDNRTNNNTSGQPDQKQDRNYSQQQTEVVVASLREPSSLDSLQSAASFEPRATSEPLLAQSSKLIARSESALDTRHLQPPVTLTTTLAKLTKTTLTTNRRFA